MTDEIVYIPKEDILFDKEEDIRILANDITSLAESIEKIGILHPITIIPIDHAKYKYKAKAGRRRSRAFDKLEWKKYPCIIKYPKDEYEEFLIQFDENTQRKNFTTYELDIAEARMKRVYEEAFPEVKVGAHMKEHREAGQKELPEKTIVPKSGTIEPPVKPYVKAVAEFTGVSESVVAERVQVGEAILQKKVNEDIIEKYKKGVLSHSKIVKKIREEKKKIKKQKTKPKPKPKCETCNNKLELQCPECEEWFITCTESGNRIYEFYVACDNYKK